MPLLVNPNFGIVFLSPNLALISWIFNEIYNLLLK